MIYLILLLLFTGAADTARASDAKPLIGWAQEASPDYSDDVFLRHLQEQKKFGATLAWVGHNNPGIVDKHKPEPGLSYAVYEALQDPKSSLHADAVEHLAAVKRLLNAARHEGLKTVLAIGYQIQMGTVWNERHPEALRRDHDGALFSAGGLSASYLAPAYQHDIAEYYRWVYREIVVPYKDVVFMLNLADEPHGGDFSSSAEAAFQAASGLTWKQAGKTEEGMVQRGRFQNLYIVNYAAWSAGVWKAIDPSVRVTMSTCGSHGRFTNFEPSIAALFSQTPDNFDITFDAFLIDNQPGDPIDGKHVSALTIFLRQVGALSQKYNKRVWLWPEANNWILSQWSPVKGNISDALFGVTLLRNMSAAAGIHLGGLAVWNLDVKEQGLFRDTHPLTYDPQHMFDVISGDFKTPADPVELRKDTLVWIPESEADELIGRKQYDHADRVYLMDVYAPLLERGIIPALSSDNVPPLQGIKTLFLLSKYSAHLTPDGYNALDQFVRAGGLLICNYPVLRPQGFLDRCLLKGRFYWKALVATVTHKPRRFSIAWGEGRITFLLGTMNEKGRNIVHDIPDAVADAFSGMENFPVDSGVAPGLLRFPQEKTWILYNTNPQPVAVSYRRKVASTLIMPDGTPSAVPADVSTVTLPHGAWLKIAKGSGSTQ